MGVIFAGLLMVSSLSIEYCHKGVSRYKGKGHLHNMPLEAQSECRGIAPTHFLPFAPEEGGRVINTAPASLPLDKTPRSSCTGGWVGPDSPAPSPTDVQPQTVRPVASNYTN